jgi:hypothetical protein
MLDGQVKAVSLTTLCKVGFNQGKNDYLVLRSDVADACKKFPWSRSTKGIELAAISYYQFYSIQFGFAFVLA